MTLDDLAFVSDARSRAAVGDEAEGPRALSLRFVDTALHRNLRWLLDQPGPRDGEPDAVV